MRLTSVAWLVLCGLVCTGCESLNKTARGWPRKDPAVAEQLAQDQQRREAAEKQVAEKPISSNTAKAKQKNTAAAAPATLSDTADNTLLRAKQAEQARQNQVAKSLYEQVLQQQPQNAEAHHRLGVLADQDGRYGEAQQHYQAALQQQPQNASLLSDVGYSFYSQDRLNEAEQYLTQALQVQPDNQYARNNLAQVYGRRAVQTGSAADYQLAKEQFTLALGPQGAEQQMQQLFPQTGGGAADRKGFPNPFKKLGQDKAMARTGSSLQAPQPNSKEDGNALLLKQMEQIKAQMQANGELPPTRPTDPRITAGAPPANVPLNRVNDELSRIDVQASRQQEMALRQGYPPSQRNTQRYSAGNAQGDWNSLEQTADWNQSPSITASRSRQKAEGAMTVSGEREFQGSMPNVRNAAGGWDQSAPPANGQFAEVSNGQPQRAPGNGNGNPVLGWEQEAAEPSMSNTWPDPHGSPTQFDARGQAWNGQGLMQNPVQGGAPNQAYEANDPTYITRQGSGFGSQRPNPRTAARNASARQAPNAGGWDDGRQTAAQLGLDAGMGDMFPGGPADADGNGGEYANNWNTPSGGDSSMYGTPTTRRGMPAGGAANVAPVDYRAPAPGYQYNGYSQGVTPAMGENFASPGGDVGAPWNQPANTGARNGRAPSQMDYQSSNEMGPPSGRFAPSRQSAPPQNFGAPPMYYGR